MAIQTILTILLYPKVELAQSGDEGSGSTLEELRAQLEEEPLRYYLLANLLTYLLTYLLTHRQIKEAPLRYAAKLEPTLPLLTYLLTVAVLIYYYGYTY